MPPAAIKNQLERLIEELSEASSTLEVIQRHYHEVKDWGHYGMYLQFQHKLAEVLMGLDKKRKEAAQSTSITLSQEQVMAMGRIVSGE